MARFNCGKNACGGSMAAMKSTARLGVFLSQTHFTQKLPKLIVNRVKHFLHRREFQSKKSKPCLISSKGRRRRRTRKSPWWRVSVSIRWRYFCVNRSGIAASQAHNDFRLRLRVGGGYLSFGGFWRACFGPFSAAFKMV